MPNKRDVLSDLHRDEVIAALDTFGLTVTDRRVKADLVEALGASRTASLGAPASAVVYSSSNDDEAHPDAGRAKLAARILDLLKAREGR